MSWSTLFNQTKKLKTRTLNSYGKYFYNTLGDFLVKMHKGRVAMCTF